MSTLGRNRKEIRGRSDVYLEKVRDDLRYKFGLSRRQPRLLNGNLKHARSMPNMNSQLQIAKQPSRPAPGLPKSPGMFGGYLRDAVDGETGASKFVVWCVDAVETTGENLQTDALYRASGNQAKVQEIAATSELEMWGKLCKEDNVNVLTGALKLFFRQLKRPLMEYSDFNRALLTDDPVEETRLLVGGLPAAERKTLAFLMHHLQKVLEHQEVNKMGIQGLGVVFGPTLMRLVPNSLDIGGDMKQQNRIIEFLLTECDAIFPTRAQLDAIDGSHKTATLDIARRPSVSSDSETELGVKVAPLATVKRGKKSDSSDSEEEKQRSDDSSDSKGSVTKRNLMTTIVRNRQSAGFSQAGQETLNTVRRSDSDSDREATGAEALYATVEKKRPNNVTAITAIADSHSKAKTPTAGDSDDEAFDLPPPPPVPIDYPRAEQRATQSRARINIAAEDVDQYNIEAISYRRKSNSESSDSDDNVKYRKRVTAIGDVRSGMIEHLPEQKETITISSKTPLDVKDNPYGHNITTIDSQYKPPASNAAATSPIDSNFSLDTYSNRYKKPLSTRQVGDEANKRISAVFGKTSKSPVDDAQVLRAGTEAGRRQKSTPVDSYQRRDGDSSSSSSESDSGDSQDKATFGQAVVYKPTAI